MKGYSSLQNTKKNREGGQSPLFVEFPQRHPLVSLHSTVTPNRDDSIRLDPYCVAMDNAPEAVLLQCL